MTFKDLRIGQTFNWDGPAPIYGSMLPRYTKISARRFKDETGHLRQVGTIRAKVFQPGD